MAELQNTGDERRGVPVVMPMPAEVRAGPVAVWITAAGWAAAARRRYGAAWVVTPEGPLSPEEARKLASRRSNHAPRPGWKRLVPTSIGTIRKDLRTIAQTAWTKPRVEPGPWEAVEVPFVWQHHELFQRDGFELAQRKSCPVLLFVDAPIVWEARKWGVRRPGWGALLERFGELPQMMRADLLACVSSEVADACIRMGADPNKVMVTPCAVDTETFRPDDTPERESNSQLTIGWVGSFRRFHGVDVLLRSFARIRQRENVSLKLVGDGLDRERIERMASELDLPATFTGMISHHEMPDCLRSIDVAVVVAPPNPDFHYSPLKLKEYMASGCAVVAPRIGEMERWLVDGEDAILTKPGDEDELCQALETLIENHTLRASLARNARAKTEAEGSWDSQLARAAATLGIE